MRSIVLSLIIFTLTLSFTSCKNDRNTTTLVEYTTTGTTALQTTISTTTSKKITTKITTSATTQISSDTTTVSLPDYNAAEISMLEQIGQPDYNNTEIPIPYVAWTEVNMDKTMYALDECIGYEFALPEASEKMKYDKGIAVHVIARTSTGYYRIENDYYIPCDFLDNAIPDGIDPSTVTSCEITTISVTETSLVSDTTQITG